MNNTLKTVTSLALIGLLAAGAALAEDQDSPAKATGGQLLVDRLVALRPNVPVESVQPTPLPGIYALELKGGTTFYGTEDGRYLFAGDLYELGDTTLVNLAEEKRSVKRRELISKVALDDMIIFPATGETKAVINVFTDVDCGYCQKLHKEMPRLNELGIEVRYLAYPRAGVGSQSYNKIVSAWCSANPNEAITRLKNRETIPEAHCDNPVAAEYELGGEVGVTGTPAIVLQSGQLLPGYMEADNLAKTLGI